jgi:hypothetical protein
MLRSGKVRKIDIFQCLFFLYRYLEIWQLLSIVPYCMYTNCKGDSLFLPFCTIGISMYQKSTLPYTLFLTYLPQAYSPLERYRQTDWRTKIFTPCSLSSFFSLSTRGPTHRRNSFGLAELWGGWPIEPWRIFLVHGIFSLFFLLCSCAPFLRSFCLLPKLL